MLTFKQFVTELARAEVTLSPAEVRELTARFGDKVLQMGHVENDGSMSVPVDCIVEAARSIGTQALHEAADSMNGEQVVSFLQSGEELVAKVIEAREQKLRKMVRVFQSEPDAGRSHQQWQQIEKEVFGVDYDD
jgi:hypothetical protein